MMTTLLLCPRTVTGARVDGPYQSLSEMAQAGYSPDSSTYQMARVLFQTTSRSVLLGERRPGERVQTALEAVQEAYEGWWYALA